MQQQLGDSKMKSFPFNASRSALALPDRPLFFLIFLSFCNILVFFEGSTESEREKSLFFYIGKERRSGLICTATSFFGELTGRSNVAQVTGQNLSPFRAIMVFRTLGVLGDRRAHNTANEYGN